jgi:hypothetical protein
MKQTCQKKGGGKNGTGVAKGSNICAPGYVTTRYATADYALKI